MSHKQMSIKNTSSTRLATALEALSSADADYWSYKRMAQRPGLHGIIRYPAMMVPRMQADVLDAAISAMPNLTRVLDPFVGSGTTLVETVRRGMSFEGYDINPLAILICRAKLLDLSPSTVTQRINSIICRIQSDHSEEISVNFIGRTKWFTPAASVQLSRIRRAICAEPNKRLRQFLWVVLGETVRQTSLSRESTYKLHIRINLEASMLCEPEERFRELAQEASVRYSFHRERESHEIDKTSSSRVLLQCRDIRTITKSQRPAAQLLLTSPPYGDNRSTIPYGQFSYLALSWIPRDDLEGDQKFLASAYAVDTASLGGSSRGYVDRATSMAGVLPSFRSFFNTLCVQRRPDLESKAAAFTADLFEAIEASLSRLDDGGVAVWTLGERTIGGLTVPLVNICREINQFFGMSTVIEINRRIQSKRMPHRNSMGITMSRETLLVMAKP